MKTLEQCRAWYEDLYIDWLSADHLSRTEKTYAAAKTADDALTKLLHFTEVVQFIYGDSFLQVERRWTQDCCDEFYKMLAVAAAGA